MTSNTWQGSAILKQSKNMLNFELTCIKKLLIYALKNVTSRIYALFKNQNSADLHTFVVKMSRVEFTRFFKTITLILLVFLLVFYSYFCLKSARISLVFSKKWARLKNSAVGTLVNRMKCVLATSEHKWYSCALMMIIY